MSRSRSGHEPGPAGGQPRPVEHGDVGRARCRTWWRARGSASSPTLPHVGGTKNPDVAAIVDLAPDLVVLDREENRLEDAERAHRGRARTVRLRRAYAGRRRRRWWPTSPSGSVAPCLAFDVGPPVPVADDHRCSCRSGGRPWMSINSSTYGASLLAHLGVGIVTADAPTDLSGGRTRRHPRIDGRRRCSCRASRTCSRIDTSPNSAASWSAAATGPLPDRADRRTGPVLVGQSHAGAPSNGCARIARATCGPSAIADRCEFRWRGALCNTRPHGTHHAPSGIDIEYDTFGDPTDPALLLVMGYTAQMINWPDEFIAGVRRRGTVRHPFRQPRLWAVEQARRAGGQPDGGAHAPSWAATTVPPVPYTLSDMAADGIGLLDHLGIERAHIAGASMGGMIVQTMAIEHPTRVASLTSIMSTIGDPLVSAPRRRRPRSARWRHRRPNATPTSRPRCAAEIWQSKKYFDADAVKAAGRRRLRPLVLSGGCDAVSWRRSTRAATARRGSPQLDVPTLVIHGRDDTLISPEGGERTAELIPGFATAARADMGHDLPRPLWPVIVDAIAGNVRVAERASPGAGV